MSPLLALIAAVWLMVTLLLLAASAVHARANPAGARHAHLLVLACCWPLLLLGAVAVAVLGVGQALGKAGR